MIEKRYVADINEDTKQCGQVGEGTNTEFYESIGMTQKEVEKAYDGNYYLAGHTPKPSNEWLNEQARQKRQDAYAVEADPIRLDWDEQRAVLESMKDAGTYTPAQIQEQQEAVDTLRSKWLAKKEEIRARYPYIIGKEE